MTWAIIQSDAARIPLKDESVQCVVTSPPYWGLRDYGLQPIIWDGNRDCEHEFGKALERSAKANKMHGPNGTVLNVAYNDNRLELKTAGTFCLHCSAWLGCLGLEPTPDLFVDHLVEIFREVRRVLRKDGTLWLNMGDCYATGAGRVGEHPGGGERGARWKGFRGANPTNSKRGENIGPITQPNRMPIAGLKPKDLVGMPWRVAFALQADGWWLRSDIIWSKPNPMPESVTDRPTKAHEYIFLLAKSEKYFWDQDAVAEPVSEDTDARYARGRSNNHKWADGGPGNQTIAKTFEHMRIDKEERKERKPNGWHNSDYYHGQWPGELGPKGQVTPDNVRSSAGARFGRGAGWREAGVNPKAAPADSGIRQNESFSAAVADPVDTRNSRSVWTMATQSYSGAHFATFPEELAERCIKAGSKSGDVVLDPFSGAATTLLVADKLGRIGVGAEIKFEYCQMGHKRIFDDAPLLAVIGRTA